MISLEQVRALEARVEKAVELIASLKHENSQLRTRLSSADSRVSELEEKVLLFQQEQQRIEEGIVQALRKLDFFEDAVQAAGSQLQASPVMVTAQSDSEPQVAAQAVVTPPVESQQDAEMDDPDLFDADTTGAGSATDSEEPSADSSQLF